jgi:hypothetical protein
MESMNQYPQPPDDTDLDALEAGVLDALRQLPCELGSPSSEADLSIRRMATARMALVRRQARLKWAKAAMAAMAACIALALYIIKQPGTTNSSPAIAQQDPAALILREVSALFPGQIQAIERDASGLQLSLADSPGVDTAQPVVLEISNNGDTREIITFSGQTIEIMGRSVTIHADPVRGIVLKGPDFDWSSTHSGSPLPDFTIRARAI